MDRRYFSEKVAEWYDEHKRDLPWRSTRDPYKIWLSEIILQQTRVIQGLPYYLRFIEKYPDVFSLASASEQDILRLWQGLGYYTRARNLHKCAKHVVSHLNGVFPDKYADLIALPGIGEYTAAAIASFSSKECVAVVDGNVFRVLSRIFGMATPINSSEGKKIFNEAANQLISRENPDLFNQGLMEFGALWCTPRQPKCETCPLKKNCIAFRDNLQEVLPVKLKTKKSRKRYFYYFVFKKGKSLLMKKRSEKDIWNGLYDFYLVEKNRTVKPNTLLQEDEFLKTIKMTSEPETSQSYKHVLSHQTIITKFIMIDGTLPLPLAEEDSLKYYSLNKIHDLPKPVLISRFLEDYNFL